MAPGKSNFNSFTGAYNGNSYNSQSNQQLPATLQCTMCNRKKSQNAYSSQMLARARTASLIVPGTFGSIRCIPCTGGPTTELHCTKCNENKGLESFSKAQRRTPDAAICLKCMDAHLAFEPAFIPEQVEKKAVADDESEVEYDSDSDGSCASDFTTQTPYPTDDAASSADIGGLSVNDTASNSVHGTTTNSITSSHQASDYFSSSMNTARNPSGGVRVRSSSVASSAQDPNKYGVPYGGPRARTGMAMSTTSTRTTSTVVNTMPDSARRFPKVRAHRVQPLPEPEEEKEDPALDNQAWKDKAAEDSDSDVVYSSDSDSDDD